MSPVHIASNPVNSVVVTLSSGYVGMVASGVSGATFDTDISIGYIKSIAPN